MADRNALESLHERLKPFGPLYRAQAAVGELVERVAVDDLEQLADDLGVALTKARTARKGTLSGVFEKDAPAEHDEIAQPPAPSPHDKPIVLIGCSQEKRDTKGAKVPAATLYTSQLFRKSLAYARAITTEDRIRILSAEHGALRTTDEIGTYDASIVRLGRPEREAWGERTRAALRSSFGQAPADVIVLAGEKYVQALGGVLGLKDRPWFVETPLDGMMVGQRLRWLTEQLRELGADGAQVDEPEAEPPARTAARKALANAKVEGNTRRIEVANRDEMVEALKLSGGGSTWGRW
jgi:hypothetical protein